MVQVLVGLRTAHTNGKVHVGVDVDGDGISDKTAEGVVDLMSTKESALRLAVDAAVTVLRVRNISSRGTFSRSLISRLGACMP